MSEWVCGWWVCFFSFCVGIKCKYVHPSIPLFRLKWGFLFDTKFQKILHIQNLTMIFEKTIGEFIGKVIQQNGYIFLNYKINTESMNKESNCIEIRRKKT